MCASALAQTHGCIAGGLDRLSAPEKANCLAKLHSVQQVAAGLHAPDNWHFVMVCGEEGWQEYSAFYGTPSRPVPDVAADTHLSTHETFLRGSRLDLEDVGSVRRILAHEVAEIVLNSTNEIAVNDQAQRLLARQAPQSAPGL